jgi:hypothetical protein
MTVAELIERLQQLPQDAQVQVWDQDGNSYPVEDALELARWPGEVYLSGY